MDRDDEGEREGRFRDEFEAHLQGFQVDVPFLLRPHSSSDLSRCVWALRVQNYELDHYSPISGTAFGTRLSSHCTGLVWRDGV